MLSRLGRLGRRCHVFGFGLRLGGIRTESFKFSFKKIYVRFRPGGPGPSCCVDKGGRR